MKIAVLVRGFHWLEKDRYSFPLDARSLIPSLVEQVLQPLREQHTVEVFAVTYPSPVQDEVLALLAPQHLAVLDPKDSSQITTYLHGLDMIRTAAAAQPFDRVLVTRFDLVYLRSALAWNVWDRSGIFFPWREYESLWNEHHRVGDAIHLIDWPALPAFEQAVKHSEGRPDLHLLYGELENCGQPRHFIEEGFYDSNTLFANRECANPIYRIGNRPRLRIASPTSSTWLRRLREMLGPRWKMLRGVRSWILRLPWFRGSSL
jgi:hypothetical protein